jgi:tRNA threonylcarbamoyladenosine biosynthesis protein TsaE
MEILTGDERATQDAAAAVAAKIRPGDVLLLRGPLGAGKTVFARALIRALTADPALDVPSPTFTLAQTYDTPRGTVWHFDLYRLEEPEEIFEIGWEEARAGGIILVEWPERLGNLAPADHLAIDLSHTDNSAQRLVSITPHGAYTKRF